MVMYVTEVYDLLSDATGAEGDTVKTGVLLLKITCLKLQVIQVFRRKLI